MAKWLLSDFFTYRFRYQIGYGLIILTFIGLLIVAGLYVPGGLSDTEMKYFVQTAAIDRQDLSTLAIPNLPFFAFQRLVMDLLGPTTFAFKLPALICAFIAGIGAVILLRRWFRPNIAVLATVIMITTGQFLYVAQSGVASITYVMWSVWLLLCATMITTSARHKRFWKILFFIAMPLSLYTPLSIYLVLAICSAGLLHPHVRYVLRKMSRPHIILLIIMSILIIVPLGYLVVRYPTLGLRLLGIPANWPPDIMENLRIIFQQYFNFVHPQSGTIMNPVLGLGSAVLILIGAWQLFTIRYTARSYTLTAWMILLIPTLLINPAFTSITFVPLLLLLASGLAYLLKAWYRMFPRNPYARFVGVVPLTILVAALVVSGLGRYFNGYRFDPQAAASFSHDLTIFNQKVKTENISTIVVTKDEQAFYYAAASYSANDPIKISLTEPFDGKFAATRTAHATISKPPSRIISTDDSTDSDRFYIYK